MPSALSLLFVLLVTLSPIGAHANFLDWLSGQSSTQATPHEKTLPSRKPVPAVEPSQAAQDPIWMAQPIPTALPAPANLSGLSQSDNALILTPAFTAQVLKQALTGNRKVLIGATQIDASQLRGFYESRNYQPIAISADGLLPTAPMLKDLLNSIPALNGLLNSDYWPMDSEARLAMTDARSLVELELLVAQGFVQLATDLNTGRTTPQDLTQGISDIEFSKRSFKNWAFLNQLLTNPSELQNPQESLKPLLPTTVNYSRLQAVLAGLKEIKASGGWPALPSIKKPLAPGGRDAAVAAIRVRLVDLGALTDTTQRANTSPIYDQQTADAVVAFQLAHQQKPDGVIGRTTLAALQLSLEHRIDQVRAVLERWRLLPHDLGSEYIFVDLAHQTFKLFNLTPGPVELPEPTLAMKVIVGQVARQTPSFMDQISDVILNPYWHAPASIVVKDILPKAERDPNYFSEMRIRVFSDNSELDPGSISWSQYNLRHLPPYQFREEPGPNNSLGLIKFNLSQNNHSIYMHDTNHHELFSENLRLLSSGCVRLEHPLDLATYLLQSDSAQMTAIDSFQLQDMLDNPQYSAHDIHLHKARRVYIVATSVSVDTANGQVSFGRDVYDQDQRLVNALNGLRVQPIAPQSESQAAP